MQDEACPLTFRAHTAEDLPFILDSWGRSYLSGVKAHKLLSSDEFHSFHRPIRERFFSKPNTCVIVCSPESDDPLILGWIAVEVIASGQICHYLYTKSAFKNGKIAHELIQRVLRTPTIFYTHQTDRAKHIMNNKPKDFQSWLYTPHLI